MSNSLIKSLAKKFGKPIVEMERLWNKAVESSRKRGLSGNPSQFLSYTKSVLKRLIKKEEEEEKKIKVLLLDPEDLVELYSDGDTPHRIRSEPIGSSSTIFKRNKFLKRRDDRDKKKGKKKVGKPKGKNDKREI